MVHSVHSKRGGNSPCQNIPWVTSHLDKSVTKISVKKLCVHTPKKLDFFYCFLWKSVTNSKSILGSGECTILMTQYSKLRRQFLHSFYQKLVLVWPSQSWLCFWYGENICNRIGILEIFWKICPSSICPISLITFWVAIHFWQYHSRTMLKVDFGVGLLHTMHFKE